MNTGLFFGHFHPVIVHLPIGFLLLAVLLEIYARKTGHHKLDTAISFALLLGFITGLIAVILGFLIATEGGYDSRMLNWHRFSGIAVSVIAFLCWLFKSGVFRASNLAYLVLTGLLVISLMITGHYGGMLTHGNDYLVRNAPEFVRNLLNAENKKSTYNLPVVPDSLVIYSHLIEPLFDKHCNQCHNPTKKKSGLMLNTYEAAMAGSERGMVIEPHAPFLSELFSRVTLPQSDPKFMPPQGLPLTYGEIQILRWWIEEGASDSARLYDYKIPGDIQQILLSEFDYDSSPKSFVEIHHVSKPEEESLKLLENNHFTYHYLSKNTYFLDVGFNSETIEMKNLEALQAVSEQVTWLDLRNSHTTDALLAKVGNLVNLTKLRLDGNPVTKDGIAYLEGLDRLEILSLYNTEVDKDCLQSIVKLSNLKKVFLGKTRIMREDITQIQKNNQDLEIVLDLQFNEIAQTF